VIPTLQHAIYARLVDAIRARLTRAGYSLLLTTSDYDLAAEREEGRILLDRGVEAMVLVGDLHDPDLYRLLAEQQVPFVNTYTYGPGSRHPCVGFDNRAATARAAEFLIELGHRDIAVIAGVTRDNDRAAMRLAGVRDMLARHGLELPASRVVESRYTIPGGREGLRALLAAEEAPTAVICGSDILAFGVLIEAASAGLRVPQQMSVVGFDNLEFAAHLSPPLTTVHVPASEMGERAADYLLARLNGHRELACLDLDVSLILRRTTAAPPLDRTS
jgi:LacI family transcriptional regulator